MASEQLLQELLQVAKSSSSFKGLSEDDIWKACLAYKNRPDEHIRTAIENIKKKDQESANAAEEQKKKLEQSKQEMISLHQKEQKERLKDERDAESILAELFDK